MMAEVLEDVFDDVEETTEVETETEKGATETEETSNEESTESTEESPSSEDVDESAAGLKATVQAERQRRQEAVAERDELRAQLDKQKAEPEKIPDAVTNPDDYNVWMDNKLFAQKLEMSEEMFDDSQGDYAKVKQAFTDLVTEVNGDGKLAAKDPALYSNFRKARSPAKFLYDHMSGQDRLKEVLASDYESKQEAKYRKKFIAEAKEKGVSAMDLPDLTNEAATDANTESTIQSTGSISEVFAD